MASYDEAQQSASSDSVVFTSSSGSSGFRETHVPADQQSRYINEFHEQCALGEGGCGTVMKVINKTDQQMYAVKIIALCDLIDNKSLTQEAELLASLNHQNIVRYHASWIETWHRKASCNEEAVSGSSQEESAEKFIKTFENLAVEKSKSNNYSKGTEPKHIPSNIRHLFIQMELCSGTLRCLLENSDHLEHEQAAHLLFGIIKGLKYVHSRGLIHRDLNPNNIFLDDVGTVKIGDFGLTRRTQQDMCTSEDQVSSLYWSKDVGTSFYKAPEINVNYDNRVDLYSLGIILVELSYPLKTRMERKIVLEDVRRPEIVFPKDFLEFTSEWQKTLAESLLSHSADARPSLEEILVMLSEKYPLLDNINLEEFMGRALRHPSSKSYKKIVQSCFNQESQESGDMSYGAAKPNHGESRTQFSIVRVIENVFRKHGALHVSTPLLTPRGQQKENSTEVQLLTIDGLVVHLPHNAKLNFARYVVLNDIDHLTRYDTLQTYEEHGSRCHPRIKYECVFDIITSDQVSVCADAHVLYALMAVFNELPLEENTSNYIAVSHTDLVKAVILSVGVREQHLSTALELVGKNGFEVGIKRVDMFYFAMETKDGLRKLKPEQIKESGLNIEKLEKILHVSGTPESVKSQLLKEIDVDCKKGVELALDFIQEIFQYHRGKIRYFQARIVAVEVAMKWCNNVHFYSGVIITGIRRHTDKRDDIIISDGGRFDDLLSSLQAELLKGKPELARKRCYGCGISVFPSKMVAFHQDFWPPELVVLICRPNQDLEKEVYELAQKLRVLGFNCREELNDEGLSIEAFERDENILCLIEFLPGGEINLTHKFTNLNQSTNTISVGQIFNPHPPTLKIQKEEVLGYFTVSYGGDINMVHPYLLPDYQMII